jgi:membrane-bound lytic murein transglycosylase A
MKKSIYFIIISVVFSACSITPKLENENYSQVRDVFIKNCQSEKTQHPYGELCEEAQTTMDFKTFVKDNFVLEKLKADETLLTGYYEPELHGSLTQNETYKYPIYGTPKDLVSVDLSSLYPKLKNYRLRGRIQENRLIPYYSRQELSQRDVHAEVIAYTDSKIDLFFLEVQGSGRIKLENAKTLFIGYANQNGQPYKSIGKYLVKLGEISQEDISLQSIRTWFKEHPNRVDEILNHNPSVVFFRVREQGATGSLGIELTPKRSIAVDRRYIPLGSMLYLSAKSDKVDFNRIVFAQDTGGAIKGGVRADMFLGFGKNAGKIAGELKAPLQLWIFKPKKREK